MGQKSDRTEDRWDRKQIEQRTVGFIKNDTLCLEGLRVPLVHMKDTERDWETRSRLWIFDEESLALPFIFIIIDTSLLHHFVYLLFPFFCPLLSFFSQVLSTAIARYPAGAANRWTSITNYVNDKVNQIALSINTANSSSCLLSMPDCFYHHRNTKNVTLETANMNICNLEIFDPDQPVGSILLLSFYLLFELSAPLPPFVQALFSISFSLFI